MNRLRKIRFGKNISQISLSQKTGISQSTLSKIEHNWTPGTPEQRRKIAEVLAVSEKRLFPSSAKGKHRV